MLSDLDVKKKSDKLSGRKIVHIICGGIAAVESVKLIRELRRHGADIQPVMTAESTEFIGKTAVEWAAAKPVWIEATSAVEYLSDSDLVLVAPATLNTLAQAANVNCSSLALLVLASQFGKRGPVLWVPTMNQDLWTHPAWPEIEARLKSWGSHFLVPALEEDRLKMPSPEFISNRVLELI
jgi:phosphopantothenoylcysteine decarboxylase/phosphopantothenate--cysteine ligase